MGNIMMLITDHGIAHYVGRIMRLAENGTTVQYDKGRGVLRHVWGGCVPRKASPGLLWEVQLKK